MASVDEVLAIAVLDMVANQDSIAVLILRVAAERGCSFVVHILILQRFDEYN